MVLEDVEASDLKNIRLVSKAFGNYAAPLLFRHVVTFIDGDNLEG